MSALVLRLGTSGRSDAQPHVAISFGQTGQSTNKKEEAPAQEIAGWLSEAGFVDARALESPGPSPLILAAKP